MLSRYTSTVGKDVDREAIARRVARQRALRAKLSERSQGDDWRKEIGSHAESIYNSGGKVIRITRLL